ncbi:MAG TPA: hypothetical protein VG963_31480, partial [Polyangiaceae bacterium]|nr:hypothetical protein [Polyangiaceae bacterium]
RIDTAGNVVGSIALDELMAQTGLGREEIPNTLAPVSIEELRRRLPAALDYASERMSAAQREFSKQMQARARAELEKLGQLRAQHLTQLELEFKDVQQGPTAAAQLGRKQRRARELDSLFNDYQRWVAETLETDSQAHLTVAAVLIA